MLINTLIKDIEYMTLYKKKVQVILGRKILEIEKNSSKMFFK